MKHIFKTLSFLIISVASLAQTKTFSIEDIFKNRTLYPKYLSNILAIPNENSFTYAYNSSIIKTNPSSKINDTLFNLKKLNNMLVSSGIVEISVLPEIKWINNYTFTFFSENLLIQVNLNSKKCELLTKVDSLAENPDIAENTNYIAYTIKNNLYIAKGKEQIAVSNETNSGIVFGQEVHRNEFGITKGTFWSPKGNYLAYYRKDETMVTDYPMVDIESRVAEVKNIKYPMAGMKSHEVTIYVYNPNTKTSILLKTGLPAEQYLTNITWSLDEKYIYVAVLKREQNQLKLNQYDAITGDYKKTLFEEKEDKYVEPLKGLYFLSNQPNRFIWQSRRDGYNHLYLYETTGKLIKQLTSGKWEVIEIIGFDPKTNNIYFSATKESPLENNIYKTILSGGNIIKISKEPGTHEAVLASDFTYFFDKYSNYDVSGNYDIVSIEGKYLKRIMKNVNPLKDYKIGKTSVFNINVNDGTPLYCRMIKPADFDSTRKYPVLVYVYGGPHNQLVTNTWLSGAGLFLNYIANKGYIVFTLDNRGTSNRGKEFEQAIFRNLGDLEIDDQMQGVNYLKKLSFIDTNRIGVYGWSYGGFLTLSLTLKNPGVFKTAIAGGPVIDWKYYEVMYGERYMDTPNENPEGYYNACLLNYIDSLQGKILIIHGTLDPTVVWQNSLAFIRKCIDKGKFVDYFVYTGQEHNMRGKDRMHLFKLIENYLLEHL